MRAYPKLWTAVVSACMAVMILAALFLPRTYNLTALSDWIQLLLLLSGTLALLPKAMRSHGRGRAFWALLAAGMALWFAYQAMWIYFELWLHQEVPDIFAGDIILFLHIVPMMAALALRPHAPQDEYSGSLRRLDFALLIFWWVYLYIFSVMAWQYIVPNADAYGKNLNLLYAIEKLAFLIALFVAWHTSPRGDGWKTFYANLFGASLTYAASSYVANWALSHHLYYSGSLYDIPLSVSMLWVTMIALWSRGCEAQTLSCGSASHGVWLARLGMITVFSLPVFAGWAWLEPGDARIRSFRLVLTLGAALSMGVMVFVRQAFLDRELHRLLHQSRESFANLKRLQAQIMESEKLASIGQLVGGAAHELNNPLTAMLGYSDLLLGTSLSSPQQAHAARIGQQVRRTKSLVASLVSFAKQSPSSMSPVNLTTVLRTAVRLTQPQCKSLDLELDTDFAPDLPRVLGDSNQLLQVCVQILNSAIHASLQHESLARETPLTNAQEIPPPKRRTLTITCEHLDSAAVIHIFDPGLVSYELARRIAEEADEVQSQVRGNASNLVTPNPLSGLGLSACQGILRQHEGNIVARHSKNKGFILRIELPVIPAPPEQSLPDAVPVLWQSQPFV